MTGLSKETLAAALNREFTPANRGDLVLVERHHSSTDAKFKTTRYVKWSFFKVTSVTRDGTIKTAEKPGHAPLRRRVDKTYDICTDEIAGLIAPADKLGGVGRIDAILARVSGEFDSPAAARDALFAARDAS